MKCAWEPLCAILPEWLSHEVDKYRTLEIQEIRLRRSQVPELILSERSIWLDRIVSAEDLNFVVNTASRYSPWASDSVQMGYLTASGGHRIGICGTVAVKDGVMTGVRNIQSLCIRVAKDYFGICANASKLPGSILLIGPPGAGKTTMLRDLSRTIASVESVAVVDERGELFPEGMKRGRRMDVLSGCTKIHGIEIMLRTMSPSCIAVDEITSERDSEALIRAGWCGVRLLATAHAASVSDLFHRPVYRSIVSHKLFDHILVLRRDKTWREEQVAI